MIGVGRGWKEKMREETKDNENFFYNGGTPLLNMRGRISQPLSHRAVAGDPGIDHIDSIVTFQLGKLLMKPVCE